jgi:hypothetical protein
MQKGIAMSESSAGSGSLVHLIISGGAAKKKQRASLTGVRDEGRKERRWITVMVRLFVYPYILFSLLAIQIH